MRCHLLLTPYHYLINNNMNTTEKKKTSFKRDIKDNWVAIVAVAVMIIVDVLSISGIYKNDNLNGTSYLLLAIAFGYVSIKGGEKLQQEGKEYGHYAPIIFVGGIFTAVWIGQAIDLFFK